MARTYVDADMARFTKCGLTTVDMELFDGRVFKCLEPRRLFPLSGKDKYISLLDEKGTETAIIRDLGTLPPSERELIEQCLEEYYFIPKITRILSLTERFGMVTISAETDRGEVSIELKGVVHSLKLIHGTRVLVRDVNDNRYEIPDITRLDPRSVRLIDSYL